LIELRLGRTRVSDAGLAYLKICKRLSELNLKETKVTASGINELGKALPRCRILWDGGTVGPK